MTILEQIKTKTNIDVDNMLINRLCLELKLPKEEITNTKGNTIQEDYTEESKRQLEYDLYDILMIILDNTNLYKVPREMYATVIDMTKDYWYLNKHDKLFLTEEEKQKENEEQLKVKSIAVGDTTTTFSDKQSQVTINGITYNTGTIDFNKNTLEEKYKEAFYRHRQPRWE